MQRLVGYFDSKTSKNMYLNNFNILNKVFFKTIRKKNFEIEILYVHRHLLRSHFKSWQK